MQHHTIALTTAVTTALTGAALVLIAGTASAEARPHGEHGMQRMHELMADGNPGMQRMHHRMMTGAGMHGAHSH
jgi:hypothetical protein